AVIRVDREEYHEVAVFSPDKRVNFVQAQNCQLAVKLTKVYKPMARGGEGYDVRCNRYTDVLVVEKVDFPRKEPPSRSPKTVAEILQMGSKNQVSLFCFFLLHFLGFFGTFSESFNGNDLMDSFVLLYTFHVGVLVARAAFVSATTESVTYYGNILEKQTCYLKDATGKIKAQLWDTHIGAIQLGKTYRLSNLSTREFRGDVYVTTTRQNEVQEVAALEGLSAFILAEHRVDALSRTVKRVEVKISWRCGHCKCWQQSFKDKSKNHRCERCNMLQRSSTHEPTASANFCVFTGAKERKVTVSNSVLKRYLESEGMMHLLQDSEDVEERFLDSESYTFQMQDDSSLQ
ncbi:hypothetical protein DPX16_7099, partial [Anabarilius grahami]